MQFINLYTGGCAFTAGELLIMHYCGEICLASHYTVDRSHRYHGSRPVICMPCITGKRPVLSNRGIISIDLHDIGLSYDSREIAILYNYRYRHIHSNNSNKIGSRNVERVLRTIMDGLW